MLFLGHHSFNIPTFNLRNRLHPFPDVKFTYATDLPSLAFQSLDNHVPWWNHQNHHNWNHKNFSQKGKVHKIWLPGTWLLAYKAKAGSTKHHELNLTVSTESASTASVLLANTESFFTGTHLICQHKPYNTSQKLFADQRGKKDE